jgi:hypothetical protein
MAPVVVQIGTQLGLTNDDPARVAAGHGHLPAGPIRHGLHRDPAHQQMPQDGPLEGSGLHRGS